MLFVVDLCCSYNPKANLLLDWSVVHGIKKGSFVNKLARAINR